jgi:hypothetical protein
MTEALTKGDLLVERASRFLEDLAQRAAHEGGFAAKLAEPLAEDAVFLRKLKPSLVAARLRGEPATDGHGVVPDPQEDEPPPAETPVSEPKPRPPKRRSGGPNPVLVVGIAFVVGVVAAKWIDWRGHAHPRF